MNRKIFTAVLLFLCFTLTSCEEFAPLLMAGADYLINQKADDNTKTEWNDWKENNIKNGTIPTYLLDASTRYQNGDKLGGTISAVCDLATIFNPRIQAKKEEKRIEKDYPIERKERINCLVFDMRYSREEATWIIDQFDTVLLTDPGIMKLECWDFCKEFGIERKRYYSDNNDSKANDSYQSTENVVTDEQIPEAYIEKDETSPINENITIVAEPSGREIAAEAIAKTIVCNFECDGVGLSESQKNQLDEIAEYLLQYQDLNLCIIGHTCNIGTELANEHVGLRRAQNVKNYLMDKGIAESRITVDNKGYNEPIVDNNSENNRKQNRRVEFRIIK